MKCDILLVLVVLQMVVRAYSDVPATLDAHIGEYQSATSARMQWAHAPKDMELRATWNYEGSKGMMASNSSNVCQNVVAAVVTDDNKTEKPARSEKVLSAKEIVATFSAEKRNECLKQQADRGCAEFGISTATYFDPSNEHFLIYYEVYDPSGNGPLKRGNVSGHVNTERLCAENVRSNGAGTNTYGTVEVVESRNDFRSSSVPQECRNMIPDWGLRLVVHDGNEVVCDAVVY